MLHKPDFEKIYYEFQVAAMNFSQTDAFDAGSCNGSPLNLLFAGTQALSQSD
jgi:hypothetical protein